MKKIALVLLMSIFSLSMFSQSPQMFNYQAVVRDGEGNIIADQQIGLQISILLDTEDGNPVFTETHTATTNSFGLVQLHIGDGTEVDGDFSTIDWSTGTYYLKIEIDPEGGSNYDLLGTTKLLSVPYALYAETSGSDVNDADADPENELQDLVLDGDVLSIENGETTIDLSDYVNDADASVTNELQDLSLSGNTLSLSRSDATVDLSTIANSTQIIGNPDADPTAPLFVVKNAAGVPVFEVYDGGVRIYIDDTPDLIKSSNNNAGFAVGGIRSLNKETGTAPDYLNITPDSARIYFNESLLKAGSSNAGFAVGGIRSLNKASQGSSSDILRLGFEQTEVLTDGTGTGFSVKDVSSGEEQEYLDITRNNTFIGYNVGDNISSGLYNSVIGDSAGFSLGTGSDNIFIGKKAGYKTGASGFGGNENIFIGNSAGFNTTSPVRNVFIGHEAGYSNVSGQYNTYLGNGAGRNSTGFYNTVLGALAGSSEDFGNGNVLIGYVAGRDIESGNNIMIGRGAGYNNSSSIGGNIFIGYYAGEDFPSTGNRLDISNDRDKPTLIYGEFDNQRVAINGSNTNNRTFFVNGTAGGTSAWYNDSDVRLKTNITMISSALQKVMSLNGVYFNWKDADRDRKQQIGFIAQDVEKILPEVVDSQGEYYSMQYAPVTAVLVEAMKEQQGQIEKLEEENKELKERLEAIEALLKELNK